MSDEQACRADFERDYPGAVGLWNGSRYTDMASEAWQYYKRGWESARNRRHQEQSEPVAFVTPDTFHKATVRWRNIDAVTVGDALYLLPPSAQVLVEALQAALGWIDAVPSDVSLPTMPGFDRDWVNEVIAKATGGEQ